MFSKDSSGNLTSRFSGIEFIPSTITVRSAGESGSQLSAVSVNEARWIAPEIVFARNDGNLTRMEVLLGMGPMTGVYTVLVNNIEIPLGINGANMTGTGWYNIVSLGARDGGFDLNFTDSSGNPLGDPYGSMAYLAVVVPNRINDGTTLPDVQVLVKGVQVQTFNSIWHRLLQPLHIATRRLRLWMQTTTPSQFRVFNVTLFCSLEEV